MRRLFIPIGLMIVGLLTSTLSPVAAQDDPEATVEQSGTSDVSVVLSDMPDADLIQEGVTNLINTGETTSSMTSALTRLAAVSGAGDDTVVVDNTATTSVEQAGGVGANTIEQVAELTTDTGALSGINLGGGDDVITLDNTAVTTYQGDGDIGADVIDQQAIIDATIELGAGADAATTRNTSEIDYAEGGPVDCVSEALGAVDVSGGLGDDAITVGNASLVSCADLVDPLASNITSIANLDVTVSGGPGSDNITVDNQSVIADANPAATLLAEANLTLDIDGGIGDDTITVSNVADVIPDPAGGGVETGVMTGIIDGGFGDDSIGVYGSGAHVDDLGILGGFGDDTIHVAADGQNALISGGFGNDVIINDSSLASSNIFAGAGDDLVVNNGEIDNIFAGPGQDTVMNFGNTVLETINTGFGDDSVLNDGLVGGDILTGFGDDTVSNRGLVGGDIVLGAGDDLMNVETNSGVGGIMDGGPGTDTLALKIDVGEVSEEQADDLAAQVAQAVWTTQHSGSGTITIGGQVYTWTNFEALLNLISWAIREHGGAFEINFTQFTDGRLNYLDIGAPVAIYCTWRGIEVWDIDHSSGAGTPVIVTSVPDLQQLAQVSGFDDLLTLLPDGTAQVVAADLYGGVYRFSFDPAVCLARLQ